MRALIIGGGRIGSYLAQAMREAKHGVIVIEPQEERARDLAARTSALVVTGDGTDVRLLEEVEASRADMVLALTGIDEVNLVACQLARTAFGCKKVLARLNDPANRPTFAALNVPVVSVTDLIVQVISREVALEDLIEANLAESSQVGVVEVRVAESAGSRTVGDLPLPTATVLVVVRRGATTFVPDGKTILAPGDHITAVTATGQEGDLSRVLGGSTR